METSPDLVDAKVANVLPRKSVDVRDDGHPGYLCLHLFIPIIIIMAMTISAILIVIVIGSVNEVLMTTSLATSSRRT